MKRLVVVSGLIVAICVVAGLWAHSKALRDGRNKNEPLARFAIPESLIQMVTDNKHDGKTLIGIETVQKKILLIWHSSRARGRQFAYSQEDQGTGNVDYRPRKELYEPGIHFDACQTLPELAFMGSFDLDRNQTKLSFPILVDRESGVVLINARGKWFDFNKWVVSKQGVHL